MKKNMKFLAAAVFFIVAVFVYCIHNQLTQKEIVENFGEEVCSMEETMDFDTEIKKSEIFVFVCGEVHNPGVYAVDSSDRIGAAVEAAGGFTELADRETVNLAEVVEDGMKIRIPSKDEAITENSSTSDGKININTAAADELMQLTGIGASRAEDIVRYREEHHGFKNIEEIMNVPGIKEGAFNKMKDRIKVN